MFIASNFSIEYLENKRIKGWTVVARYEEKIVGAIDMSMDTEVYKNICVCSYMIGAYPEVEREDIFKHFSICSVKKSHCQYISRRTS